MKNKLLWLSILGIILSFVGGFLLANALNKNELGKLRSEMAKDETDMAATEAAGDETTLSAEEIKQRIAEADQNPTNYQFQKELGLALYKYGAMKRDTALLVEVARLLARVNQNDPDDYDILVNLGNVHFDIAYIDKKNEEFAKAREFYEAALTKKPEDVEVRTDLGLTYFLANPSETEKAIGEFEKSLKLDPNHQKTLQVIAQAFITEKRKTEAREYIDRLEAVNPKNPFVKEMKNNLAADGSPVHPK